MDMPLIPLLLCLGSLLLLGGGILLTIVKVGMRRAQEREFRSIHQVETLMPLLKHIHGTLDVVHQIVNSRTDRLEAELRELRGKLDQATALALHTEAIRNALTAETVKLVSVLKETLPPFPPPPASEAETPPERPAPP